jgi:hypothetical protein
MRNEIDRSKCAPAEGWEVELEFTEKKEWLDIEIDIEIDLAVLYDKKVHSCQW